MCHDLPGVGVGWTGRAGARGPRHDLLNVVLGSATADEYHSRLGELPLETHDLNIVHQRIVDSWGSVLLHLLIPVDGQRHADRAISQGRAEDRESLLGRGCENPVIVSYSFTHHLK